MKVGFEVNDDGLVILKTDWHDTEGGAIVVRMSPRFVTEMFQSVRDWNEVRSHERNEAMLEGRYPIKGRGATNVDPDGVERGWVVEDIYE